MVKSFWLTSAVLGLALAGCGGTESPNPLNGTTLDERQNRGVNRTSPLLPSEPAPVYISLNPSETPDVWISLQSIELGDTSGARPVFASTSGLHFRTSTFANGGRKYLFVGTMDRTRSASRLNLKLGSEIRMVDRETGELTPKKLGTGATIDLSFPLDPNLKIQDALVIDLIVGADGETIKVTSALGSATDINKPENHWAGILAGITTGHKGTWPKLTFDLSGKGTRQATAITESTVLVGEKTKFKQGAVAELLGGYDAVKKTFAPQILVPGRVAGAWVQGSYVNWDAATKILTLDPIIISGATPKRTIQIKAANLNLPADMSNVRIDPLFAAWSPEKGDGYAMNLRQPVDAAPKP